MSTVCEQQNIYIVLSQTGSVLSRIIKIITHKQYSHASISLTKDLKCMYSFGRKYPYNPFWGGFVCESPDTGTMKRFSNSDIVIIEIDINSEKLEGIYKTIWAMLLEQEKYHYNFMGLLKAWVKIKHPPRRYHYYCSEFVSYILKKCDVMGTDDLPDIVHPTNFLDLPYSVIYKGKLCDYCHYLE